MFAILQDFNEIFSKYSFNITVLYEMLGSKFQWADNFSLFFLWLSSSVFAHANDYVHYGCKYSLCVYTAIQSNTQMVKHTGFKNIMRAIIVIIVDSECWKKILEMNK